jgi:CheY-like chemotaxis protein
LGLSITKKLLDLLGGNIKVESGLESGTSIFIEIPLELTNPLQTSQEDQFRNDYPLRGLKILLIEDDPIGLKLIKLFLEAKGAIVHEYQGGLLFKNQFRPNEFDLAIVDIQMPEVSGLEVLEILRSDKTGKSFPVIAITANVFAEEKNQISNLGFDSLLLKPFDADQIISKIKE